MFRNLRAEMARYGFTHGDIAEAVGITKTSVSSKLLGKQEFSRKEMLAVRNELFPNLTISYLFELEDATA